MSFYAFNDRVIGGDLRDPLWNRSFQSSQKSIEVLAGLAEEIHEPIMVNNPPGLFVATGITSIAIPNGSVDALIQAADTYQAKLIILDINHTDSLSELYTHPDMDPRLLFLGSSEGIHYLMIKE
jgi:hypothetical protein